MFNQKARSRLSNKLDYEYWSLNELENQYDAFPDEGGRFTIEDGGLGATVKAGPARTSQSRVREVIQSLYPLVFASSYKCIDMIIEWILEENRGISNHKWGYRDKYNMANSDFPGILQLPMTISPEIFERLLILYDELMDHRHAVIHRHEFDINDGDFIVEDSAGAKYEFDDTQLFSFAKTGAVSAETILDDSINETQEREIKRYLDNLNFVHERGTFDIAAPWSPTIEYHAKMVEVEPLQWEVDMDKVQKAEDSTSAKGYYLYIIGKLNEEIVYEWKIPNEDVPNRENLELNEDSDDFDEFRL